MTENLQARYLNGRKQANQSSKTRLPLTSTLHRASDTSYSFPYRPILLDSSVHCGEIITGVKPLVECHISNFFHVMHLCVSNGAEVGERAYVCCESQ